MQKKFINPLSVQDRDLTEYTKYFEPVRNNTQQQHFVPKELHEKNIQYNQIQRDKLIEKLKKEIDVLFLIRKEILPQRS